MIKGFEIFSFNRRAFI